MVLACWGLGEAVALAAEGAQPGTGWVRALPVVGYCVSVQQDACCLQKQNWWQRGGQGRVRAGRRQRGAWHCGSAGVTQGAFGARLAVAALAPKALTSLPAVSWPQLAKEKTETGGGAARLGHQSCTVMLGRGPSGCLKPGSTQTTTPSRGSCCW